MVYQSGRKKGRMNEMEHRPSTPENNARFWQHTPEYHGVLADAGEYRLAISPNGKRYQVQQRFDGTDGAVFSVVKWRKSLDLLRPDIPAAVASLMPADLPDDPTQFPRLWAGETAAASLRFRRANPSHDEFAGVIAKGKNARLVWLAPIKDRSRGPRYSLQVKECDRWKNVASSVRASYVHAIVFGALHRSQPASPACGDPALQSAVARLPQCPADYRGQRPEPLHVVQAALGRGSASSGETRQNARQRRAKGVQGDTPRKNPQSASSALKSAAVSK